MRKYLLSIIFVSFGIGQTNQIKSYIEQNHRESESRNGDTWKMVSEDKYSWQNSDWQISNSKTYVYNFDHLDTLYHNYGSYDATQGWEYSKISFYDYDSNGNNTSHTIQWLNSEDEWDNDTKYDYSYDQFSNNIARHTYDWNNDWELSSARFYDLTYDENSNVTIEVERDWSQGNNDTTNSSISKYTYYDNGLMQSDTAGYWDNNNYEWRITVLRNYAYDEFGNDTSYVRQIWSDSISGWLNQYWYQYYYDIENRLSGYDGNYWINGEWEHLEKFYYNEDRTASYYEYWDDGEWVSDLGYFYELDEFGNRMSRTEMSWENGEWVNIEKRIYEWESTLKSYDEFPVVFFYRLHPNYPNPFNPITTLRYELPEDSFVDVTVYDMLGNVVNNLVDANQSSGYKSVQWNATNNQGEPVSAGVYLYKIQAGDFVDTKKMIFLK